MVSLECNGNKDFFTIVHQIPDDRSTQCRCCTNVRGLGKKISLIIYEGKTSIDRKRLSERGSIRTEVCTTKNRSRERAV